MTRGWHENPPIDWWTDHDPAECGKCDPPPSIHTCAYMLWTGGRWVSASACHWGQTITTEAPSVKPVAS